MLRNDLQLSQMYCQGLIMFHIFVSLDSFESFRVSVDVYQHLGLGVHALHNMPGLSCMIGCDGRESWVAFTLRGMELLQMYCRGLISNACVMLSNDSETNKGLRSSERYNRYIMFFIRKKK